jgi:hypothetical protein
MSDPSAVLTRYVDVPGKTRVFLPKDQFEERYLARVAKSGSRLLAKCRNCGRRYWTNSGHVGSDDCLVQRTLDLEHADGFVVIHRNYIGLLSDSGIETHVDLGATEIATPEEVREHIEKYHKRPYKNVAARTRMFGPAWASYLLNETKTVSPRRKRVAILRTINESDVLRLEFNSYTQSWERSTFMRWVWDHCLRRATRDASMRDKLEANIDDLHARLSKYELERR